MPTWTIFRKYICMFCALLFAFGWSAYAVSAQDSDRRAPKFRWAFGAIRGTTSASQIESVSRNMLLGSGDKLKMMVELHTKCFVYLIHKSSQGTVTMLFPYSLKQFDSDYGLHTKYFVPKGEAWFQLDDKAGTEIFYLVASDQRLLDVEYAYDKYVTAELSKKEGLAGQILAEIENIRQQTLVASVKPGKMLAKAETGVRGFERATGADPTDISAMADDIAFTNLYSETFVIEHR